MGSTCDDSLFRFVKSMPLYSDCPIIHSARPFCFFVVYDQVQENRYAELEEDREWW